MSRLPMKGDVLDTYGLTIPKAVKPAPLIRAIRRRILWWQIERTINRLDNLLQKSRYMEP
jgi:hypothetical protein